MTADALAEALREGGLRVTRQRREVHDALRRLGGHRSADEVLADLRARGARVSRASVYNALADLTAAGAVMRADAGPGRALFEAQREWHHHFVCRRCGALLDVPCAAGRKPCLDLPAHVGVADETQVIFRGVCRACGGRRRPTARRGGPRELRRPPRGRVR